MELFPWLSQSAAEVGVKGIASRDAGGWGARGQNPRVTASVLQPLPAVVELCPGGEPLCPPAPRSVLVLPMQTGGTTGKTQLHSDQLEVRLHE